MFRTNDISFIIYQMGKVGSSSISNSLKMKYGKSNVLHTHSHQEAKEQIERRSKCGDTVVIITGFREPLSRCISAYFQNVTNSSNHWYVGNKKEVMNKSIEWLIDDFKVKVVPHINKMIGPWLSNYENVVGCKLKDFNNIGSYWKASFENTHFYIYKLETITEFFQEMANDAFMKDIKFTNSNIGGEKWNGETYRDFKSRYRISKDDYDNIYGCIDYVSDLYSKNEIRRVTNSLVFNNV